jgi:hypothetical protein
MYYINPARSLIYLILKNETIWLDIEFEFDLYENETDLV